VKALIYVGTEEYEWRDHPDPVIKDPTDIILRITTSTICGTDLHVIRGGVPDTPLGTVLGHEGVGLVEEVGPAVRNVSPGDRVLATAMTACGACRYCTAGMYGQCLNGGWALGHHIDGVQAEYARIPFARNSVYKIPEGLTDEQVIFLTDILVTGYEIGVLRGCVAPGDTVVIVGAGPVGLATTMTASLFSPANIVVVDLIESRRKKALELGATHAVTPEEARDLVPGLTAGLGADVTIEAAGFPEPFELAVELVRPGGHIANIGVHEVPVTLHLEALWSKQVTLTTGIPSALTAPQLMRAIESGSLDATKLITHRLPMAEMMKGYELFRNAGETQALKVLLLAQ
jgi:alcohol dehydrogenase